MDQQEQNKDLKINKVFNPKIIKKGVVYFLSISVISLVAIFLYTNSGKTLEVWKQIHPLYLLLTLVFVANDLFLGAFRNHIFVKEFKPGGSFWISFKANLANIFMGAVTPSQSGGGIAQFYIFYKNGVKLPDAITLSFINWISTLLFFPIAGIISYFIIKDNIPPGFITYLAQFGFSIFTILITVVLVALFFPHLVGELIIKLGELIRKVSEKWSDKISGFGLKAKTSMIDYRTKCVSLLKRKPQLMLFSFLITILLYLNKFFLAYIIVLALGAKANLFVILAIQAIIYLLLYFAPSPGGSGIAELSIAGLMAGVISEDYIGTFTVLQRSLLIFIPAIIGSFVVLKELNKESSEEDSKNKA
ncbi:MAG: flippase-like domain-containing protein [Saprospiraceae bacterium]|nr:flippase-like domain-containing protein [Bacteroidia bacterium]NNE13820.1 flippase-like domain-containing protein [Saprospiraceae bacterium]NNL92692.1 flippase-like domain-containing protein [Saprospiraceae bacterium]